MSPGVTRRRGKAIFAKHERVKHSAGEYVRGDVHTNSVEGYFSIFKRGMRGVYQHCKEKHLHHRYLAEFDFRDNNRIALGIADGDVRPLPSRAPAASASRIVNLTKPDYRFQAARFMRWRQRRKRW